MDRSLTSLDSETECLRRAYAALNRGEVAGFLTCFAPVVERTEFGSGGTHRLEELRAQFEAVRAMWAEGACEPERFEVVPHADGHRIIAFVHVRVRLASETQWRDAHIADVFVFRDGRVTVFHSFADEALAREWIKAGNGGGTT